MDSMANALSKEVALEFFMNHATVSMSTSYFSPDYSGFFVLFCFCFPPGVTVLFFVLYIEVHLLPR